MKNKKIDTWEEATKRDEEWNNSIEGVLYQLHVIGDTITDDDEDKILIVKTLLKLPKKIKRKVLDNNVLFILMKAVGTLGRLQTPLPFQDFIILNFSKMKKGEEMDTIAHEIAHFILGHASKMNSGGFEREADDLTEKWGFKRNYKEEDYKKMEKKR